MQIAAWNQRQRQIGEGKMDAHLNHKVWFQLQRIEDELYAKADGWKRTLDAYKDRTIRVRTALSLSESVALHEMGRHLAGINISTIWHILIAVCKDIALYYGGSVVLGASVGAIVGAFFGGVGAVPGAFVGAEAGSYVGGWIMGVLGLKSLVKTMVDTLPLAARWYELGFREAWGPMPSEHASHPGSRGDVRKAAYEFGQGHVLLILAIFTALVAFLTKGKGNKAVVLKEIRESPRLGPDVANWVEKNEDKLLKNPELQERPKTRPGGNADESSEPARRPSQRSKEDARPLMNKKQVPCFKPNDLPQNKIPEFDRQLAAQQDAINEMTVQQYQQGRDAFESAKADGETIRDPNVARGARTKYQKGLAEQIRDELLLDNPDMSYEDAESQAADEAAKQMKTLAALHNPDLVAGGKDVIADFGDSNVNSRIGAGWPSRVGAMDNAAAQVPEADRPFVKMNVALQRCK